MSWGILRGRGAILWSEREGGGYGGYICPGGEGIGTLKGGICHALWRRVGD